MSDLDPYRSGTSNDLPPELWIGKVNNEWPLRVWASPEPAARWLADYDEKGKRLWHVTEMTVTELRLTPPVEQKLVPVDEEGNR